MRFAIITIAALLLFFATVTTVAEAQDLQNETNATAPQEFRVITTLRTYADQQIIRNMHVSATVNNTATDMTQTLLLFAGEDGNIQIDLQEGDYNIEVFADDPNTPGKDYYIKQSLPLKANTRQTAYMYGVGSARGTIYAEKNVSLPNASVEIKCGSSYGITGTTTTDAAGMYLFEWVPTGLCQVTAVKDGMTAHTDSTLDQGALMTVDLTLSKYVAQTETPQTNQTSSTPSTPATIGAWIGAWIGPTVIAIILAAAILFYVLRLGKEQTKQNTDSKGLGQRQTDILTTLSSKEKDIVEFIIREKGKTTQSKLRYELGIPKTTIARLLTGLEIKNIIRLEKVGKLKKIYLSEFFKGNTRNGP
jgi:uncharacterized membrane protein